MPEASQSYFSVTMADVFGHYLLSDGKRRAWEGEMVVSGSVHVREGRRKGKYGADQCCGVLVMGESKWISQRCSCKDIGTQVKDNTSSSGESKW